MRLLNFVAYLFYRYYSKGRNDGIPYFNTLTALVMLSFLNLMAAFIVFNATDIIPSVKQNRGETLLKMMAFISPLYLLFFALVRKKKLTGLSYPPAVIKSGNLFLISYIVGSMVLLIFLIIIKKGLRSVHP